MNYIWRAPKSVQLWTIFTKATDRIYLNSQNRYFNLQWTVPKQQLLKMRTNTNQSQEDITKPALQKHGKCIWTVANVSFEYFIRITQMRLHDGLTECDCFNTVPTTTYLHISNQSS